MFLNQNSSMEKHVHLYVLENMAINSQKQTAKIPILDLGLIVIYPNTFCALYGRHLEDQGKGRKLSRL